jgi:hypothetical protein
VIRLLLLDRIDVFPKAMTNATTRLIKVRQFEIARIKSRLGSRQYNGWQKATASEPKVRK